jgi:hypothetical protein
MVDSALRILAARAPALRQSCCGSPTGPQDTVAKPQPCRTTKKGH